MRRNRDLPHAPADSKAELTYQPFRSLAGVRIDKRRAPAVPADRPMPGLPPENAESLFQKAVADVKPLALERRQRVAGRPPASRARAVIHPDAEALAELGDLVTGSAPFDITDSDEYVEGLVAGADPRLVRRLRRGEFAFQAHLDLHGMTAEQARMAVDDFLMRSFQAGRRCVLIIHGRGRNSRDQIPVLKSRLTSWLARGQWSRLVLAFASARPCDGGVGALYVLLRRRRDSKRRIQVVNGAKH